MRLLNYLRTDSSLWILFLSNLLTIYFAVQEQWALSTVLLIYWFQSAANGFFYVFRMQIMRSSIKNPQSSSTSLRFLQQFFLFHFGGFLLMYLLFIVLFFQPNFKEALPFGGLFFVNHAFSYFYNREEVKGYHQAILGFFMPYARNIPMHIIVAGAAIFSGGAVWTVVVFLSLKTGMDLLLHTVEHLIYRSNKPLKINNSL